MKKIRHKKKAVPINKKIRNAKKIVYDNIQFQSKLELHCYKKLKEAGLEFQYEPIAFELIPKFEYIPKCFESSKKGVKWLFGEKSKLVRAMTYKPDFVNLKDGWIIECKGHPNETFPAKWKLFKQYLKENNMNIQLYMPKNQKHVDECVTNILTNIYDNQLKINHGRETIL